MTLPQIRMLPDWHFVPTGFAQGSAAMKAWQEACDCLHVETGVTAAEDAEYALMCEVDHVLREIMAIRARTVEGLRLKVRVAEAASFDHEELLPALIADIEAMAIGREVLA